jgi:mRNA-degrading endonuclease YafQ of YafQ-DinJ toxin-antitoxin module
MQIFQTTIFEKTVKKMLKKQKADLDKTIKKILANPEIGTEKKGDLKGIFIYKFKSQGENYLLAYRFSLESLELVTLGTHENYYRNLKKYLK